VHTIILSVIFKSRNGNSWHRRQWLDFRNGHSIYLVFIMTFANFVTIQYSLLIDKIPAFNSRFNNIWTFAIMFICTYVPLGMIIGYWHRKSQWKVEAEAMFKENQIGASIWLFVIDLIDGKVSEEEKTKMRYMLSKIAGRTDIAPTTRIAEIKTNMNSEKPQRTSAEVDTQMTSEKA
jgi:hypothetical protein